MTDSPPRTGSRSTVKNLYKKRLASAAGGIGITPFMSMLRQAAHDHLARRLVLLYSNRRPEDAAFLAELMALEGRLESFRLLATMTAMRQSSQTWGAGSHAADANLTVSIKSRHYPCFFTQWVRSDGNCRAI